MTRPSARPHLDPRRPYEAASSVGTKHNLSANEACLGPSPAAVEVPQSLAEVIAFLASDAARAIHGAAIPVTGLS